MFCPRFRSNPGLTRAHVLRGSPPEMGRGREHMFPSISLESCHAFNREDRISFHVASFLRMDASSRTEIREGYRSKPLSYSNSRNVANYRRRIAVEIANTGGRCPINFFLSLFSSSCHSNCRKSPFLLSFINIPPYSSSSFFFESEIRFAGKPIFSIPFV